MFDVLTLPILKHLEYSSAGTLRTSGLPCFQNGSSLETLFLSGLEGDPTSLISYLRQQPGLESLHISCITRRSGPASALNKELFLALTASKSHPSLEALCPLLEDVAFRGCETSPACQDAIYNFLSQRLRPSSPPTQKLKQLAHVQLSFPARDQLEMHDIQPDLNDLLQEFPDVIKYTDRSAIFRKWSAWDGLDYRRDPSRRVFFHM
jgi:hypothetical protein